MESIMSCVCYLFHSVGGLFLTCTGLACVCVCVCVCVALYDRYRPGSHDVSAVAVKTNTPGCWR